MKNTRLKLMLDYPFFGTLALSIKLRESFNIKTMHINGKELVYNPDFTSSLSKSEKLFAYLHEIGHIIFMHHFRRADRDSTVWNMAGDYAINIMLLNSVGLKPPDNILLDFKYKDWSTERIYEDLVEKYADQINKQKPVPGKDPGTGAMSGQGEGQGDQNQDQDQEPGDETDDGQGQGDEPDGQPKDKQDDGQSGGKEPSDDKTDGQGDPDNEDQDNNKGDDEQEPAGDFDKDIDKMRRWGEVRDAPEDLTEPDTQGDMSAAVTANSMSGGSKIPEDSVLGRLLEDMTSNNVPWQHLLRQFVNQSCEKYYNWFIPNRRYLQSTNGIIMPTLKSNDAIELAVVFDTSYSIDMRQCSLFFAEFKNLISQIEYSKLHVLSCSHYVSNVKAFYPGEPIEYTPSGIGGTAAKPVWEYFKNIFTVPTCLVYFTDLEVFDWGEDPRFPVLWLGDCTSRKNFNLLKPTVPFGETVFMEKA